MVIDLKQALIRNHLTIVSLKTTNILLVTDSYGNIYFQEDMESLELSK